MNRDIGCQDNKGNAPRSTSENVIFFVDYYFQLIDHCIEIERQYLTQFSMTSIGSSGALLCEVLTLSDCKQVYSRGLK